MCICSLYSFDALWCRLCGPKIRDLRKGYLRFIKSFVPSLSDLSSNPLLRSSLSCSIVVEAITSYSGSWSRVMRCMYICVVSSRLCPIRVITSYGFILSYSFLVQK